jgi:hypothetical protein
LAGHHRPFSGNGCLPNASLCLRSRCASALCVPCRSQVHTHGDPWLWTPSAHFIWFSRTPTPGCCQNRRSGPPLGRKRKRPGRSTFPFIADSAALWGLFSSVLGVCLLTWIAPLWRRSRKGGLPGSAPESPRQRCKRPPASRPARRRWVQVATAVTVRQQEDYAGLGLVSRRLCVWGVHLYVCTCVRDWLQASARA